MRFFAIFTAAICFLFTSHVQAAIELTIPDDVEVLLVDSKEVELESSFLSATSTLKLQNGEHQIVFRYNPVFKQGKNYIIVPSDIIVAKFSTANQEIEFKFPSYYSAKQAEAFNTELNWSLVNSHGAMIPFAQAQLIHHGVQIGRNIEFELAQFNSTDSPAAFKEGIVATTHSQIEDQEGENTVEQMLHYWYQKADKKTKERFIAYILKNN